MNISTSEKLQNFISGLVPEWQGNGNLRSKFRAYTNRHDETWPSCFKFWSNLIIGVAVFFDKAVIDPAMVRDQWFKRKGVVPLCLDRVMGEMIKTGELTVIGSFLQPSSSWVSITSLMGRLSLLSQKESDFVNASVNELLVVMAVLEAKCDNFSALFSEKASFPVDSILTNEEFLAKIERTEDSEVIQRYLMSKNIITPIITQKDEIEGLKLTFGRIEDKLVTENDKQILRLKLTLESFAKQRVKLSEQKLSCEEQTKAASNSQKPFLLKRAKVLEKAMATNTSFVEKIETALDMISDMVLSRKMNEAVQVGLEFIQTSKLTEADVQSVIDDLESTMNNERELQRAFLKGCGKSEEFELELEGLNENVEDIHAKSSYAKDKHRLPF